MTAGADAAPRPRRSEAVRWLPKQFGAWAILAVPLLLGVAATRPSAWHLVLGLAAAGAYLGSVAVLEWSRTRRAGWLRPAAAFGVPFVIAGLLLVAVEPRLIVIAAFAGATSIAILLAVPRDGPRGFFVGLLEIAQALALAPAAALVSDAFEPRATALATFAAALYLVGSLLVVRSLIRERGNRAFLGASLAYHVVAVALAVWFLPLPYAVLMALLLLRAALLPATQAQLGPGPRRLRPIHVGLVEIVASLSLVGLGFVVGF